jgi:hypothetical protein
VEWWEERGKMVVFWEKSTLPFGRSAGEFSVCEIGKNVRKKLSADLDGWAAEDDGAAVGSGVAHAGGGFFAN